METELGPCAQFSIYHLMQLKEGEERLKSDATSLGLFRCRVHNFSAEIPPDGATRPVSDASIEKTTGREELAKHILTQEASPHSDPKTLGDIAKLIRSKNAGPYEVTLDVMFDSEAGYQLVKESNFLHAESMAHLFDICEADIVWQGFFDQALAYKVTIPRFRKGKPTPSGGFMESDVHASQQYTGFMNLALPESLQESWKKLLENE